MQEKKERVLFGETFSTEGWKVSFLDKDPKVVEALKTGSYIVTAHQENGDFKRIITDYDAYLTDAAYSCMDAVVNCDVIALHSIRRIFLMRLLIWGRDLHVAHTRKGRTLRSCVARIKII